MSPFYDASVLRLAAEQLCGLLPAIRSRTNVFVRPGGSGKSQDETRAHCDEVDGRSWCATGDGRHSKVSDLRHTEIDVGYEGVVYAANKPVLQLIAVVRLQARGAIIFVTAYAYGGLDVWPYGEQRRFYFDAWPDEEVAIAILIAGRVGSAQIES